MNLLMQISSLSKSKSTDETHYQNRLPNLHQQTLVVVGNGMVGHAFCERMVRHGGDKHYRMIVFGDEPRPAYDRVNLTKFLSGSSSEDLSLASQSWYQDHAIELRIHERVIKIDPVNQVIFSDRDQQVKYDKLVLATGSRPFVPPIEGTNLPGVFVYRTIEDLEAIKNFSQQSKTAAVLGGGLLGLEAGKALYDLGLETHIIEMAPALMPRQLDQQGATILKHKIESLGVHVHLIKRTTSITSDQNQITLHFQNDETLNVDMVVISAGIRPRDELSQDTKIERGTRGGYAVDDHLQTSIPNIYAIGECASHRDFIYGLAGPGYQMADVLSERLMGKDSKFLQGDLSSRLKLMDIAVATIGEPLGEAEDGDLITSLHEGNYRKLIVKDRKILGAMSVGDWPEGERVRGAIESGRRFWSWQIKRFIDTGHLWSQNEIQTVNEWPATATVCSCVGVNRGELSCALADSCSTVEELANVTGASKVCGSCKPLLAELVGESLSSENKKGVAILCVSAIGLLACLYLLIANPIAYVESVQSTWYQIDLIWRDNFWKQVTGYTLLSISLLAMVLSFRKRMAWFTFGEYGFWRTLHTVIGVFTLLGIVIHTGMHWGSNLNFLLAMFFIGLNLIGTVTGVFTALESKTSGSSAMIIRTWRPRLLNLHIWLLWPLPVLVIFHIISVYYY